MTNIQNKYIKLFIAFASSFLMGINAYSYNYNIPCSYDEYATDSEDDFESWEENRYNKNRWNRCKNVGRFVAKYSWKASSWGFFLSKKCSGFTKDFLDGSAKSLWNAYDSTSDTKDRFSYSPKEAGELGTKAFFLTGYVIALIGKKTAEWSEIGMDWAENASHNRYKSYLDETTEQITSTSILNDMYKYVCTLV